MNKINAMLAKIATSCKGSAKNAILGVFLLVFSFSCQKENGVVPVSKLDNQARIETSPMYQKCIYQKKEYLIELQEDGSPVISDDYKFLKSIFQKKGKLYFDRKTSVLYLFKNSNELDEFRQVFLAKFPKHTTNGGRVEGDASIRTYEHADYYGRVFLPITEGYLVYPFPSWTGVANLVDYSFNDQISSYVITNNTTFAMEVHFNINANFDGSDIVYFVYPNQSVYESNLKYYKTFVNWNDCISSVCWRLN